MILSQLGNWNWILRNNSKILVYQWRRYIDKRSFWNGGFWRWSRLLWCYSIASRHRRVIAWQYQTAIVAVAFIFVFWSIRNWQHTIKTFQQTHITFWNFVILVKRQWSDNIRPAARRQLGQVFLVFPPQVDYSKYHRS